MDETLRLPEAEYRVLKALDEVGDRLERDVEALAQSLGMDQSQIAAAVVLLEERGWVKTRSEKLQVVTLTEGGRDAAANGLPERRVIRALAAAGGELSMKEVAQGAELDPKVVGGTLRFLRERGWAEQNGPRLSLTGQGRAELDQPTAAEQFLSWLEMQPDRRAEGDALHEAPGELDATGFASLEKRRFVEVRRRTQRYPRITEGGRSAAARARVRIEISQLTPEHLASGAWRDADIKRYDVNLDVAPVTAGKIHPLQQVIQETRQAFLRLGFTEIASPFVESGFWDFDALFQPQDHPAREMQDTFYLERPGEAGLPRNEDLVARVRAVHEDGGETGSRGWEMPWDPALARRTVLRTHTTAATARALAQHPEGPHRVFYVGRVFRREAITFKHLPVFTQVDGIIIDEQASFSSLLGTLGAFYEGMGFKSYEFRPAFFPYTEPSVEVHIYYEPKQTWVEMGGAGVFRPEVTRPLGCKLPVLAWGLGLERLAMLRYGVLHMRDLYVPDIQWLKEAPLCPSSESR
ncbi:MAG: phenylalanine--tRNA ligase subunit alpha [Candidatus Eisenbacteria bacterium]|nr:phenylalanine--tRNA ligase subunit alpha [Candidatus Eisenbacteria bacterium]